MSYGRKLSLILLIALLLRLAAVILTLDVPIGLDDMFQYDMLARSIVMGNGYRWYAAEDLEPIERVAGEVELPPDYDPRGVVSSFRGPGYPAFLALVYAVVGIVPGRLLAARLAQAVLGAGLAPLTGLLGRYMGLTERSAVLGAAIVAGYPLLIIYPLALASENLYVPLFTFSLLMVLRAAERGRARDWALSGLLLGVTALTRSIVSLFVPVAALWVWMTAPTRRAGLRNAGLLVLSFMAVILPWMVRNTLVHGQVTFIETSLGYNLYMGYHPISAGAFDSRISRDLLTTLDDAERNRLGMEAFWSFVRAEPGRVPYLMLNKLAYFWESDKRGPVYFYSNDLLGEWPAWQLASALVLICGPFLLIALAGLAGLALAPSRREVTLVALLVVYYTAVHMFILGDARFHLPLVPLLALYTAQLLVERTGRQARRWQKVLAGVLVLGLLAVWGHELIRDWDVLVALLGPGGNQLYLSY
jgi:hypothetical protein